MGAGILPVSVYKNNLYLLFSREHTLYKGRYEWRDFGGTPENNETVMQTAIREGWEESSGFLGSKLDIKKLIKNNLITKVSSNGYTVFIVLIEYDRDLPKKFRKHFMNMYRKDKSKICVNGLYEKDKLRWIKVTDIKKNMGLFRNWYKKLVNKIYDKLK